MLAPLERRAAEPARTQDRELALARGKLALLVEFEAQLHLAAIDAGMLEQCREHVRDAGKIGDTEKAANGIGQLLGLVGEFRWHHRSDARPLAKNLRLAGI